MRTRPVFFNGNGGPGDVVKAVIEVIAIGATASRPETGGTHVTMDSGGDNQDSVDAVFNYVPWEIDGVCLDKSGNWIDRKTGYIVDPQPSVPRAPGVADGEASGDMRFRSDTSHIFRDQSGHLVRDTAANRALILSAVSPQYVVFAKSIGASALHSYQRVLSDGRQVWAEVRDQLVNTNGGVNLVPR